MDITSALVHSILEKWQAYEWTVQGFGFLRTKIQGVGRIHIWDSRLAAPLVSTIHTHPWPLRSTIISGELVNHRFAEVLAEKRPGLTQRLLPYRRATVLTGEGGGVSGESVDVMLCRDAPDSYTRGESYEQEPHILHRTIAEPGTVTLIERPQGPPLEEALVYWPRGTDWVSAEPRSAEPWAVERTIGYALARWNAEAS